MVWLPVPEDSPVFVEAAAVLSACVVKPAVPELFLSLFDDDDVLLPFLFEDVLSELPLVLSAALLLLVAAVSVSVAPSPEVSTGVPVSIGSVSIEADALLQAAAEMAAAVISTAVISLLDLYFLIYVTSSLVLLSILYTRYIYITIRIGAQICIDCNHNNLYCQNKLLRYIV